MENAVVRVPSLEEMEVVRLVNGPEAFTPDNEFILGPTDVRGLWTAAGFCAHGLAGAGGMGRLVAEWIVDGLPSLDTWEMDSRRFGRAYRSLDYTLARTKEVYETYYDVRYPGHERQAGRPLRALVCLPRPPRPGRGLRREVGLGARELVRAERGPGRSRPAAARLGRAVVVACDRRGAPCLPAGGGVLRRVVLREDRGRPAKARPSSSSGCAPTASRVRSAGSSIPRC